VPEFLDPFAGIAPERKLTKRELARALRLALSAEEEAVHLYEALADAAADELARAVLQEIADEERVHAGEFQRLLNILLPDEEKLLAEGAGEVDDTAGRISGRASTGASDRPVSKTSRAPAGGNARK